MSLSGHRSLYIRSVLDAFSEIPGNHHLKIWLPEISLCEQSPAARGLLERISRTSGQVELRKLEEIKGFDLESARDHRFEIVASCVELDQSDACFLPRLDSYVKDMALFNIGAFKARVSGILFQPSLHYSTFPLHRRKDGFVRRTIWLKKYLRSCLFVHRRFVSEILTFDPFAPDFYNRFLLTNKFRHVPDYALHIQSAAEPRRYFQLPEGKTMLLFPGSIARRKGILEFLRALLQLVSEQDDFFSDQVVVVIAGRIASDIRESVLSLVTRIRRASSEETVFVFDRFLTDEEFVSFISASDIVCMPYIEFIGMSGILVQAAALGKPVLAPEFGLIGELVRRYKLGILCRPTDHENLIAALSESLERAQTFSGRQQKRFKLFAEGHSLERLGREICDSMMRTAKAGEL
jgi:glycosyltransferase involved in cell wall biosynthesis